MTTRMRWSIGLLLASLVYLVVELIFNATLLDVASAVDADKDALDRVELFGRSVSGAGFALAILGFAGPHLRTWALRAVVAALAWNAMFFGQKWLVDVWLIAPSSWEVRHTAQAMQLLKTGLARNVIAIEGAPLDMDKPLNPQERTFLALLGMLVMESPDFIERARESRADIIERIAHATERENLPTTYSDYRRKGDDFQANWTAYRNASERYSASHEKIREGARSAWADFNARAYAGWEPYLNTKAQYDKTLERKAQSLASRLQSLSKARAQCRDARCLESIDNQYRREVGEQPWSYWCEARLPAIDQAINIGLENTLYGALTGRRPSITQYNCSCGTDCVIARLKTQEHPEFERKTGYPYTLRNRAQFADHPKTVERMRLEASKKGIVLPDNWTPNDSKSFISAVEASQTKALKARWTHEVPPGLAYSAFVAHPSIQARIKTQMGEHYVPGMHFEMSEAQFKKTVLDPQAARAIEEKVRQFEEDGRLLGAGQPKEHEGEQYLRSVLVPPISLFLSLFFAILTFGKSLYGMVTLSESTPGIVKGVLALGVALLMMLPPLALRNTFSDSPAFNYFAQEAARETGWKWAFASYTMRVQPVIYPLGSALKALPDIR